MPGKPNPVTDAVANGVSLVLKQQGRSSKPEDLVPGVTGKDITVDGAAGKLPGAGHFLVVVYFHGGCGWVISDRKAYDGGARGLEKEANVVVVSVCYRQAPEANFPAA